MKFDIDGTGERDYTCSAYTLMVYEQEFGSSLVKDYYGKIDLRDGDGQLVTAQFVESQLADALPEGKALPKTTRELVYRAFPRYVTAVRDYTQDNWEAILRALWAMRKTADEAAGEQTPAFKPWVRSLGEVNLTKCSNVVFSECERCLFRAAS